MLIARSPGPDRLRRYIEDTRLHIYSPLDGHNDFEIIRLGPFFDSDSFVSRVYNLMPEFSPRIAKLRITFTWMPKEAKGRTLVMRLDSDVGKQDAFDHICGLVGEQYNPEEPPPPVILEINSELRPSPKIETRTNGALPQPPYQPSVVYGQPHPSNLEQMSPTSQSCVSLSTVLLEHHKIEKCSADHCGAVRMSETSAQVRRRPS